jgi:hypothetical protein
VPYLLAVAMASNVGSTATITGNPQNIMIGSFSHIPYTKFSLASGAGRAGRADHRRGATIAPSGIKGAWCAPMTRGWRRKEVRKPQTGDDDHHAKQQRDGTKIRTRANAASLMKTVLAPA